MDSEQQHPPPQHHFHHHYHHPPHPHIMVGHTADSYPAPPTSTTTSTTMTTSTAPAPALLATTSATTTTSTHSSSLPVMSQQHQIQTQNPNPNLARFPFNTMVNSSSSAGPALDYSDKSGSSPRALGVSIEPARKKRGRPRKYSSDGNIALGLSPTPVAAVTHVGGGTHGDFSVGGNPSSEPPVKRSRGRPPGSGKRQLNALGTTGVGFTPHVITVKAGEDIASKVMAFAQQGPRIVCILSANGAICNVTLRQGTISGGTVTYEGRFEIIYLSGSFIPSDGNGSCNQTGGLSVSLAGSDGRVFGGGVAGMLMAASAVQVVVGSFTADGKKSKPGPLSTLGPKMLNFGAPVTEASPPPSQGTSSDSSDDDGGSPLNHGQGSYSNPSQPMSMPMYTNMGWPNSSIKMHPN